MEYFIWCDESDKNGERYSNFYGGVMVDSVNMPKVTRIISNTKNNLNFKGEIKWTKVTQNYLEKYKKMMDVFFYTLLHNNVKVRIMFTNNKYTPLNLTNEHKKNEFHLLYYQFIKHAFGLNLLASPNEIIYLKIFFDKLPDKKEKNKIFKDYIYGLNKFLNDRNIFIRKEDIAEVESHKHNILQCLDVVLGAMSFKLNQKHKRKPNDSYKRGKRTIAKENLYRHIYQLTQLSEFVKLLILQLF
jgi:hypothetical protein